MGWLDKRRIKQLQSVEEVAAELQRHALRLADERPAETTPDPSDEELKGQLFERMMIVDMKDSHFSIVVGHAARRAPSLLSSFNVRIDFEDVERDEVVDRWRDDPAFQELVRRRRASLEARDGWAEGEAPALVSLLNGLSIDDAQLALASAKPRGSSQREMDAAILLDGVRDLIR